MTRMAGGEDIKFKLRILIVDDEASTRDYLRDFLKTRGFEIQVADTGAKALDLLRNGEIQLALVALTLPDMSGFELCRIMKKDEVLRVIPVIFLSAYYNPEEIKEGYQIGANDFMSKPFIKEELFAKIKVHLRFAELSMIESISE